MPSLCIFYQLEFRLRAHVLFGFGGVVIIDVIIVVSFWTEPMCIGVKALELTFDTLLARYLKGLMEEVRERREQGHTHRALGARP